MVEMKEKFDILTKREAAYSNFMDIKDEYQQAEDLYSTLTNKLVDLQNEVFDLHRTKMTQIRKLAQELFMLGNHETLTNPLRTSVSHTPNNSLSQAALITIIIIAVVLVFILTFICNLFDNENYSMQNNTEWINGYREFKATYSTFNEAVKSLHIQEIIKPRRRWDQRLIPFLQT